MDSGGSPLTEQYKDVELDVDVHLIIMDSGGSQLYSFQTTTKKKKGKRESIYQLGRYTPTHVL